MCFLEPFLLFRYTPQIVALVYQTYLRKDRIVDAQFLPPVMIFGTRHNGCIQNRKSQLISYSLSFQNLHKHWRKQLLRSGIQKKNRVDKTLKSDICLYNLEEIEFRMSFSVSKQLHRRMAH